MTALTPFKSPVLYVTFILVAGVAGAGFWLARSSWQAVPFVTSSDNPRVRDAYAVARRIPSVLDQLPCHCGCMSNKAGHTSNLDCFRTAHAETCPECVQTAMHADRMERKGESIESIRRFLTNVYSFQLVK
jgi:hypothetical protein